MRRGVARLRERGILLNGFFLLGTDHDGPEAFGETVRFARDAGCTLAGFMPLTPYPGTPMWKKLEREERIFIRDWELYDMQHVVIRPKRMSAFELYARTLACYPAFYGGQNPWKQARRLAPHWPTAALTAIGLTWPLARHWCWSREVIANAGYVRELLRLGDDTAPRNLPSLNSDNLWLKDLFSGRSVRRSVFSRAAARAGAAELPPPPPTRSEPRRWQQSAPL